MTLSPRQTKEYDCGVVAVKYLLELRGHYGDVGEIEKRLGTTPDEGTSHEGILSYLNTIEDFNPQPFTGPIESAPFPCIVNYWWGGDGHYAVVVSKTEHFLFLFNPASGEIERWRYDDFNNVFFSMRYGPKWSCSI